MEIGLGRQRILVENFDCPGLEEIMESLKKEHVIERLWAKDYTLWKNNPREISDRLGWLHSHREMYSALDMLYDFAREVRAEGYSRTLLLGMGGSSLAPEVFNKILGSEDGFPLPLVLDSTHPGAVLKQEKELRGHKTLFIISTKSGGTVETISLMKYFYNQAALSSGNGKAGKDFVAVTDPGSGLEKTAKQLGFKKVFLNNPEIGGRFSALSYFGLLPLALSGKDPRHLLDNALEMEEGLKAGGNPLESGNSAAWLGAALGHLGLSGKNKVTLVMPPEISPLGAWMEQLLAESTGKEGKGLLPVNEGYPGALETLAEDRVFIYFRQGSNSTGDRLVEALKKAGHPVASLNIRGPSDLGGEMLRWMIITATACRVMKINPFNQPDVESSKIMAREMIENSKAGMDADSAEPVLFEEGLKLFCRYRAENLKQAWNEFIDRGHPAFPQLDERGYVSIQAFLEPGTETDRLLQRLAEAICNRHRLAVTTGYGPRYLHSTGQLHKGDSGRGLFIQLTATTPCDLPVPGRPGEKGSSLSFGRLIKAQADGDRKALTGKGREVIRFHIAGDLNRAFEKMIALARED